MAVPASVELVAGAGVGDGVAEDVRAHVAHEVVDGLDVLVAVGELSDWLVVALSLADDGAEVA